MSATELPVLCVNRLNLLGYVLQEEHPDIKFIKFDTTLEQLQDLGSELGVKALPNIRFLKDGQPAAMEVSGYKKKQVDSSLAELVSA